MTALVRSPEKICSKHDRLCVIQGDVRDAGQLQKGLAGQDAVLSALGRTARARIN